MTQISWKISKCAVCNKRNLGTVLLSTSSFGEPDLDTRPAGMARGTLGYSIKRCTRCGYCAPDIAHGSPLATQVVKSAAYQAQRKDINYPALANTFLCWAMIEQASRNYAGAAWAAISAAWVCDDKIDEIAADLCRLRAIEFIRQAKAEGESLAEEEPGAEEAILCDLLRRSGQFDQAKPVCQEGLAKDPDDKIRQMLVFQQKLVLRQDRERYTIADAAADTIPQHRKRPSYSALIGGRILGVILSAILTAGFWGCILTVVANWFDLVSFVPFEGVKTWVIVWLASLIIAGLTGIVRRAIRKEHATSLMQLLPCLVISSIACGIVGWQIGLASVRTSDGAIFGALAGVLGGLFVILIIETLELPKLG